MARRRCTPSTRTSTASASAQLQVGTTGTWQFEHRGLNSRWATWRDELRRKVDADLDEDLSGEVSEGVVLLQKALEHCEGDAKRSIQEALAVLDDNDEPMQRKFDVALGPELFHSMEEAQTEGAAQLEKPVAIEVDHVKARFSAWYELFRAPGAGSKPSRGSCPRSPTSASTSSTLLPFRPIGRKNRKGRNDSLTAGPDESRLAVRDRIEEGGHFAVHPELGAQQDVKDLCATAHKHGMDVALDIALNASADHPWLAAPRVVPAAPRRHAQIRREPAQALPGHLQLQLGLRGLGGAYGTPGATCSCTGSAPDQALPGRQPAHEAVSILEWVIKEVHKVDRDVVFLSEAFTRRAVMRELADSASRSPTRTSRGRTRATRSSVLRQSLVAWSREKEYFRPNFFPVTPDILHAYLQHGGPPAFVTRLVLAGTLSPSYGIYSGYRT